MEILILVFLLYYGAKFLFLLFEFLIDSFIMVLDRRVSRKNRKIIRHWEWLRTMGYEETALAILKKMNV